MGFAIGGSLDAEAPGIDRQRVADRHLKQAGYLAGEAGQGPGREIGQAPRPLEPETRRAILAEAEHDGISMALLRASLSSTFALDPDPVYEPDPSHSVAAIAMRR